MDNSLSHSCCHREGHGIVSILVMQTAFLLSWRISTRRLVRMFPYGRCAIQNEHAGHCQFNSRLADWAGRGYLTIRGSTLSQHRPKPNPRDETSMHALTAEPHRALGSPLPQHTKARPHEGVGLFPFQPRDVRSGSEFTKTIEFGRTSPPACRGRSAGAVTRWTSRRSPQR